MTQNEFFNFFRDWYKRFILPFITPPAKPQISAAEPDFTNAVIGIDAGKGSSSSIILIEFNDEKFPLPIPVFKFETFAEAKSFFKTFICDGSCRDSDLDGEIFGDDYCRHIFKFNCPQCLTPLEFALEEIDMFVALGAGDDSVCALCWEKTEEFQKLAA